MFNKKTNLLNTAIVHVKSTFNNTLICVTDLEGNVIVSGSGGSTGLKGQKRSTYYAAQTTSNLLAQKSYKAGIRKVYIRLNGFGDGREACIKSFLFEKLEILKIQDITKIAHGGCKLPKKRRV
jgi:small subunit ribosomal protein S11